MLRLIRLRKILLCEKIYYILFALVTLYALLYINLINYKSNYNLSNTNYICTVESFVIDGNKLTLKLKGKDKLIGSYYFDSKKDINNFINNVNLGDTLSINGTLIKPKNNTVPNVFNYKKYLYNKNIHYILNIDDYKVFKKNKNILYSIKNLFYKKCYKSKNRDYYYTFLVGEKKYVGSVYNKSYSINGISHLFSLSGLHVTVFSLMILFILNKTKLSEMTKHIIIFIVLMLLCFITAFLPSITRSVLFFFLLGINKIQSFYISTDNVLLIVYVILVIINPFIILDLGFELSFTITYFLVLGSSYFNSKNYFINVLKVSVLSFIASAPILIYNFYTVNILSIIINIFFVPFVSYIVYPASLITFIFPFLSGVFNILCIFMEKVSYEVSKLNFLSISIPKIPLVLLFIYFIILFYILKTKKKKYTFFLLVIMLITYIYPFLNNKTKVYFLDVGQGDCTLVVTPHLRKTILIDTGGKMEYKEDEWKEKNNKVSLSESTIIPFLKSIGVKKIDIMLLTHGHDDHLGEANNIMKSIKTNKVYINKGKINSLESKLIKKEVFNKSKLNIDNVTIYNLEHKIFNDENSDSIVLLMVINNKRFLLMGDATKQTEEDILSKYDFSSIDVLKVGHHGSKTSSGENFITKVNPKVSIISAGLDNKFNHPNYETINLFNKYNYKYLITFKTGSIIYELNDKSMSKKILLPYN
ncbi:MAG: DNA internalization-related competence protein ComEC/Rec2 [Bacilli bacterium]